MVNQHKRDLVLVSIGPVQSFIATARRTQDSWTGSQLLSQLALVGLRTAENVSPHTVEFISPAKLEDAWPGDIPNRFLIAVPGGQGQKVAQQIEQAVREAWEEQIAHKVHDFFGPFARERGWQEVWQRQVHAWPNIYWIVWPWGGQNYGEAYRRAGLALSARKQIRDYPLTAERGEKCSLCGQRQALHGETPTRHGVQAFWQRVRDNLREWPRPIMVMKENERLCALCTVKRFAAYAGVEGLEPDAHFPSTSSVATATYKIHLLQQWEHMRDPTLRHLDNLRAMGVEVTRAEILPYLTTLAKGKESAEKLLHYDGEFFFPESFSQERLAETLGREPQDSDVRAAARALASLRALLAASAKAEIPPPTPYLAVLALDGDKMGALLGGCEDIGEHQKISVALASFAQGPVPEIVEQQHAGRLIYAGGDDVLALLPVDHALETAQDVQQKFTATLQEAGYAGRTASAGLVITHHKYALEGALRRAKSAEHEAKHEVGRNALVIDLARRSGEDTQVGLKWFYPAPDTTSYYENRNKQKEAAREEEMDDKEGPAEKETLLDDRETAKVKETVDVQAGRVSVAPIDQVRQRIVDNILSGKVVYDLRAEAAALNALPLAAQAAEIERLLTRHWQPHTPERKREIQELVNALTHLAYHIGIEALVEGLLVARFLSQGGEQS